MVFDHDGRLLEKEAEVEGASATSEEADDARRVEGEHVQNVPVAYAARHGLEGDTERGQPLLDKAKMTQEEQMVPSHSTTVVSVHCRWLYLESQRPEMHMVSFETAA